MSLIGHKHRHKHRINRIDKLMLLSIIPIAIVAAVSISIYMKTEKTDEAVSNGLNSKDTTEFIWTGSAVRKETSLRENYESLYRLKNSKIGEKLWNDKYGDILQNNRTMDKIVEDRLQNKRTDAREVKDRLEGFREE